MRRALHVSLPPEIIQLINRIVIEEKFASKSEFIRFLIRLWDNKKYSAVLDEAREDLEIGFNIPIEAIKELEQKIKNEN